MTNIPDNHTPALPSAELLKMCIHCGLCLSTCPTYVLTKSERSSPRGRLKLIRASREHEQEFSREFVDEMYYCLECLACETACPAGVPFGSYMESVRTEITAHGHLPLWTRISRAILVNWTFRTRRRFEFVSRMLSLMRTIAERLLSGARHEHLKRLGIPVRLLGLIPRPPRKSDLPEVHEFLPTFSAGAPPLKVGFSKGCAMDVFYEAVNTDAIELLRELGCHVFVPPGQWCCGSLHAHQGEHAYAMARAREFLPHFDQESLDVIVTNAAGCSSHMKKYYHLFEGDNDGQARARGFAAKVVDVVELIERLTRDRDNLVVNREYVGRRVTFDDPCHLVHAQKIRHAPRNILRSIPQIEFVELPESDWCCGSAGIYNIFHHKESMQLLDRKIGHIKAIGAEIVITSNPGCMIQLKHGLVEHKLNTDVLHLVTFLRRALAA